MVYNFNCVGKHFSSIYVFKLDKLVTGVYHEIGYMDKLNFNLDFFKKIISLSLRVSQGGESLT